MSDAGLWDRAAAICDAALSRDVSERAAFLELACGGDGALRREVDSLLTHESRADGFLSTSALELLAHTVLTELPDSLVGQQLGPYEVEALIGTGGMGVVYRAKDPRLQRQVAIKALPSAFSGDPDRLRRFEQEARAAAALNDSNILAVYDVGRHNHAPYLVSELLEGESLAERLTRGSLRTSEAVDLAVQLARALAAAHDAGIIHRDVKPANVFLTQRGQVKLLDLGIAKVSTPPTETTVVREPPDDALTGAGKTIGTTAYMSPEQAEGRPLDARTDVFSFGTVLYEMVAGRRPFQGDTQLSLLSAILHAPVPSLRAAGVRLPGEVERIVMRCLDKDPANRYANGRELLSDLEAVSKTAGVIPTGLWGSRKARAIGVVGATVVAVVVGGGLWRRASRERWALETALPEIQRLVDAEEYGKAVPLLREARAIVPNDATFEKLWLRATSEFTLATDPKDLGRLLDYLGTRKDFDSGKIAYFGFSAGGAMAPILLANEPRVKVAILTSGGVWFRDPLPEVDWVNFVTRVTIPVLMLNGRYDNYFPVDAAQAPLFRMLGTPAQDKKHIVYDAGHGGEPHREVVRESLDWLDRYLGPVAR